MDHQALKLTPIGYLDCEQKYRYEAPRQSILAGDNLGVIRLNPECNYEQALVDLAGFERIWLIYQFHQNRGWKPKVIPPRSPNNNKISLFATRSPHRPNPLGLSCVEMVRIDGLDIFIRNFDLLDGTPIFDIKPYIPYCDSFENSAVGWLDQIDNADEWKVDVSSVAEKQMEWIYNKAGLDIFRFTQVQLSSDPLNNKRKRVTEYKEEQSIYCLAYRTWRIVFHADDKNKLIRISNILSGYSDADLMQPDDKYKDKGIHRLFNNSYLNPLDNL